jgi:hypothetical protein
MNLQKYFSDIDGVKVEKFEITDMTPEGVEEMYGVFFKQMMIQIAVYEDAKYEDEKEYMISCIDVPPFFITAYSIKEMVDVVRNTFIAQM